MLMWQRRALCHSLPPVRRCQLRRNFEEAPFRTKLINHPAPWSLALLQKTIVGQLLKNFQAFYGSWRYTTTFTRGRRYWSLSWARRIQPTPPHPISLRSISILSFHLLLGGLPVCGCFTKPPHTFLFSCTFYMPCQFIPPWLIIFCDEYTLWPLYKIFSSLVLIHSPWVQIFSPALFSQTLLI
jgi:hypothetical protein